METIINLLDRYTSERPDDTILYDEVLYSRGITYAQLDDLSGRVYAYLKKNGIGREAFVLLDLPRGAQPIIAMIGVWKAGAAFVLVEDTYAPERISFIRKDCGCRLELNASNWDEVMHMEPLAGYETPGMHDAAYAIYTSGTTGTPKGVLHEYGNLGRAIDSIRINGVTPFNSSDRVALLSPLNFVASIIVILKALSIPGARIYVVSYATLKNPTALAKYFLGKRISITFLTPSYVRMMKGRTGPFLRMIFVGSEPANNLYFRSPELINIYACSESGFAVGVFRIDRAYDTCPIGKPEVETGIRLIREDGKEAGPGETGELCFENPYVRGYLNLPEETERSFVDGIYHTGDLARREENGNYVILGRSNDMIKINGNRIEPAEIEAAVKQALGVDWAAARGFEENGKSYLCAYYTADVKADPGELREEMLRRLPYYMIPSYYMRIDKIPLKSNGKLDRSALPKPETVIPAGDYAAPSTETEKTLCEGMQQVLRLERVGIHDDFYEMGGDSLASLELISACGLPGLTASEVFRGRTPEKIAKLYEESREKNGDLDPDEENRKALQKVHPLTAEQLYMIDYQLYTPSSTMYNLFTVIRLDREAFDAERMAEVMQEAIRRHPALLTVFSYDDDGYLQQSYKPENLQPIHVERLSEFEFRFVKDTLIYPFKIIGGRMYRCRVFETEKAVYVFFDVHHSLFDGTSMKVLLESISRIYAGVEDEEDYYYLMLQRRENAEKTAFYEEARKYFEERYDGIDWCGYPRIDHESRANEMGELIAPLDILQPQMAAMERQYRISRNEFFIAVATLAIHIYNGVPDIKISWIYNGREDEQTMSTVGLLFRDLPVGIRFRDETTLRELFADVHDQVQKGIEHSCYPYVDRHNQVAEGESAYLLYQQDIRDMEGLEDFQAETLEVRQNQAASQTILDMEILDGADGLQLMIDYAASRYNDESMEKYKDLFIRIAQSLVIHNSQEDITVGELKKKLTEHRHLLAVVTGIFRRKK